MKIDAIQREKWIAETKNCAFNRWLAKLVRTPEGKLDLDALYRVAEEHGVYERYDHLNRGQQRMNIGNRLRKQVDPSVYE